VNFPEHKCGLYLTHNQHRDYYEPLAQWIEDQDDQYDWDSDEAKARAIATDECWTLQWYPETPIGFNAIAAPTLNELLARFAPADQPDECCRHGRPLHQDCFICSETAPDQQSPLNQCDGCARGLPMENGIHRGEGYDLIGCTADRYTDKT
jgi:hypothetical protein